MKCLNCNSEIISKSAKKFCSSSCSAKYNNKHRMPRTLESRKKTSDAVKNTYINKPDNIKKQNQINRLRAYSKSHLNYLFNNPFDELAYQSKRTRIIIEQECKCAKCGLSEWMGEPICFEMDHIDGDKKNNTRNNLEILCPNCHSNTPTWKGRKNKRDRSKILSYIELRQDNSKE